MKIRQTKAARRDRDKSKMVVTKPPTIHASIADDIEKLLEECEFWLDCDDVFSDRDFAITSLIADTGLQPVDLIHLTWRDLLPQHNGDRLLDVSKIEIPINMLVPTHGKGKSNGSLEHITLSEVTRYRLKELLREGNAITDPVFMSDRIKKGGSIKEVLTQSSIQNIYSKVKNHFKLNHLTVRALRKHYGCGIHEVLDLDDDLES